VFSKRLILRLPSKNDNQIDVPQQLKFSVYLVDAAMRVADDSRLACVTLALHELFELKQMSSSSSSSSSAVNGRGGSMSVWVGREVTIPLRNNDRSDIDSSLQAAASLIILKCSPLRRVSIHVTPSSLPSTPVLSSSSLSSQGGIGGGVGVGVTPSLHVTKKVTINDQPKLLTSSQPSLPSQPSLASSSLMGMRMIEPKKESLSISQMDKSKEHLAWHISVEAK
jgi:hypothetical protein